MILRDRCQSNGQGDVYTCSTMIIRARLSCLGVRTAVGIAGKNLGATNAAHKLYGSVIIFAATQHGRQHAAICRKNAEQDTEE